MYIQASKRVYVYVYKLSFYINASMFCSLHFSIIVSWISFPNSSLRAALFFFYNDNSVLG